MVADFEQEMGQAIEEGVEQGVQQVEMTRRRAAGSFFLGMLIGAFIGGAAALLFAPRAGRETRAIWKGKAEEAQEKLQEGISKVKERASRMRQKMQTTETRTPG